MRCSAVTGSCLAARQGENRRIAITTATNIPVAVASTNAAPNARFHAADRLLAHENTVDATKPNPAAATIASRIVTYMPATSCLRPWLRSGRATINVRVPFFFRDAVLVDETAIGARDWLAAGGADNRLALLEKHNGLPAMV